MAPEVGCSNCTFMELKFGNLLYKSKPRYCSNCTFMELKYAITIKTGAADLF